VLYSTITGTNPYCWTLSNPGTQFTTDDRNRKHGHTYLEQRRRGDTECSIVHWQYRTLLYPSRDARASSCATDT